MHFRAHTTGLVKENKIPECIEFLLYTSTESNYSSDWSIRDTIKTY